MKSRHASRPSNILRRFVAVLLVAMGLAVWGFIRFHGNQASELPARAAKPANRTNTSEAQEAQESALAGSDALKTGRALALQVCGACHLFPEPAVADRFTWANGILPRMNDWLGYQRDRKSVV